MIPIYQLDRWYLRLESFDGASVTVSVWSAATRQPVASGRAEDWSFSGVFLNEFEVADDCLKKLGSELQYVFVFEGRVIQSFDRLSVPGYSQGRRGLLGEWCLPARIVMA